MLDDALEAGSDAGLAQLAALGANYACISFQLWQPSPASGEDLS